jgi:hypothetical protein
MKLYINEVYESGHNGCYAFLRRETEGLGVIVEN